MLFTAENGKEGSTKDTSSKEGICKGSEDTSPWHSLSVRVEKADPKNSKMIIVQPHVGNLEDAEIINFMVWMDMYFQQENKPEHMMQLFSMYSAIEEADGMKEKHVSCRALNQQRVEICIGENCGSSLWLQRNTAFKILVDEVINFYMECHVCGEISNMMPVSFNVVKRTMLNYFESMCPNLVWSTSTPSC
jgi:hypothetical protein